MIGNPSVLLLDEPSSGLDAGAKRNMWDALRQFGKDRSIVLTTHSMEEADALAQRAGIMSTRMLTVGTVDALRNRWGNIYHVQLVMRSAPHTTLEEMGYLRSWIQSHIEGADVEEKTFSGQMRFSVPAQGGRGKGAGQLFRLLESNKEGLGVEYYSIGQTTMDEVFVRIVRKHGGEEENEKSGETAVAGRRRWRGGWNLF